MLPVVGSSGDSGWRESGILNQAIGFVLMGLAEIWFHSCEDFSTGNFINVLSTRFM
jgi:hypothetical protein